MKLLFRSLFVGLFLLLILGTACSNSGGEKPVDGEVLVAETAVSSETPLTSTPIPTIAPPTVEPTPLVPYIDGIDQPVTDEGRIILPRVVTTQAGWVVVYAQVGDDLADILGYTALTAGINEDVVVQIDPMKATQTVVAMLHVDETTAGKFDFPNGPDAPLKFETAVIAAPIQLDFQLSQPIITIANQDVTEAGLLAVESVLSPVTGWLVIHADDHGELGAYLGSTLLEKGLNENLTVHIPWRDGTPTLYGVMYEDNGRSRQLDFSGKDVPLLVNGDPVIEAFQATYPPDIYVLDQPIVNGTFEVERVISNGPGYLVVYYDNEGDPGLIIGSEAIEDGLNEQVKVEVLGSAVTPILHIRIHADTEAGDIFDFPRVDPPILYDGRLPATTIFGNDPGNYLITQDQPAIEEDGRTTLTIPYAIVNVPAWIVLHADNEGQRGELLGFAPLNPGINRDTAVDVDAAKLTDTVYAVLYLDAGEIGEFEFPDGDDAPLQRSREIIQAPFQILRDE